jgi:hypothetical protein
MCQRWGYFQTQQQTMLQADARSADDTPLLPVRPPNPHSPKQRRRAAAVDKYVVVKRASMVGFHSQRDATGPRHLTCCYYSSASTSFLLNSRTAWCFHPRYLAEVAEAALVRPTLELFLCVFGVGLWACVRQCVRGSCCAVFVSFFQGRSVHLTPRSLSSALSLSTFSIPLFPSSSPSSRALFGCRPPGRTRHTDPVDVGQLPAANDYDLAPLHHPHHRQQVEATSATTAPVLDTRLGVATLVAGALHTIHRRRRRSSSLSSLSSLS